MRATMRVASAILAAGLGCLLVAGTASAQSDEDCTWFPDLRCGRTDGRWEGFEKPIVSFAQFEDPFITTGLYPYFMWHEFPSRSVMGGSLPPGSDHRTALTRSSHPARTRPPAPDPR